jgi:hypothetical protein
MWDRVNPPLFPGAESRPQGSPLSQVLLDTLKSKSGTASLEELKESAVQRGVPFGGKQPGRTEGGWELEVSGAGRQLTARSCAAQVRNRRLRR